MGSGLKWFFRLTCLCLAASQSTKQVAEYARTLDPERYPSDQTYRPGVGVSQVVAPTPPMPPNAVNEVNTINDPNSAIADTINVVVVTTTPYLGVPAVDGIWTTTPDLAASAVAFPTMTPPLVFSKMTQDEKAILQDEENLHRDEVQIKALVNQMWPKVLSKNASVFSKMDQDEKAILQDEENLHRDEEALRQDEHLEETTSDHPRDRVEEPLIPQYALVTTTAELVSIETPTFAASSASQSLVSATTLPTPAAADCVPDPMAMCTMEYAPVCGADGHTYSNRCEARTNCQLDATDGSCSPPIGQASLEPVSIVTAPTPAPPTLPPIGQGGYSPGLAPESPGGLGLPLGPGTQLPVSNQAVAAEDESAMPALPDHSPGAFDDSAWQASSVPKPSLPAAVAGATPRIHAIPCANCAMCDTPTASPSYLAMCAPCANCVLSGASEGIETGGLGPEISSKIWPAQSLTANTTALRGGDTNSTALSEETKGPHPGMVLVGVFGLVVSLFVLTQRSNDFKLPCFSMSEARKPRQLTQVELDGPFYGTYDVHDDTAGILANEGGPRVGSYAPPSM